MTGPTKRTHRIALWILAALLTAPAKVGAETKAARRLSESREVLVELAGLKEGAPREILEKAKCVIVIPGVKKAALGIGGRFGYGAAVCRTGNGEGSWGPPLMVSLKGASVGFQIGGQSSDFVLLVMNQKGVENLLKSKFTLGVDASVAAGPIGRNAEAGTDARMRAEILSYSRSRGIFAGISLEGASLRQDTGANHAIYGERADPRTILLKSGQPIPHEARGLVEAIDRLTSGKDIGQMGSDLHPPLLATFLRASDRGRGQGIVRPGMARVARS